MRVVREKTGREITLAGLLLPRGEEASVYAVPNQPDLAAARLEDHLRLAASTVVSAG